MTPNRAASHRCQENARVAALVERVTALDPDAEMLDEARAHAATRGVDRIEFIHARAEDIANVGLRPAQPPRGEDDHLPTTEPPMLTVKPLESPEWSRRDHSGDSR